MKKLFFLLALTIFASPAVGQQAQKPSGISGGMLRYPDVSSKEIVFSYAGDLWTVSRDGGTARPLASPPGRETFPRFSPDGNRSRLSAIMKVLKTSTPFLPSVVLRLGEHSIRAEKRYAIGLPMDAWSIPRERFLDLVASSSC